MTTEDIAERPSQVPDLVRTPALEITSEDVAMPRLYIGQFMSHAVQSQLVQAGQIFAATGQDDPDPNVLYTPGTDDLGPLFYVLGLRKGKSISEGGELQLFDFDDPSAPPEAWVTYNYSLALPEVDEEVPFKLLLTRTGRPAAQQINTILVKNANRGPRSAWHNAFRLTSALRENKKGKFYVPRVSVVEAGAPQVAIAEKLAVMISASPADHSSTGTEPAI